MDKFIGVDEVEEDDEVQITVTYNDGAESVTTGRVRCDYHVWGGGRELRVGPVSIDKLGSGQTIKHCTIELLRRDEKHGYYLAALKDSWDNNVFLWKYHGVWQIVESNSSGFETGYSDDDEPSSIRRFIGTELP